jgi:hypothetical protein
MRIEGNAGDEGEEEQRVEYNRSDERSGRK